VLARKANEMVLFRWFLPQEGGGHVRRYLKFRKAMWHRILNNNDAKPCPPITLFDFADRDDAVDASKLTASVGGGAKSGRRRSRPSGNESLWKLSDDRVIGGYSEAVAKLFRTREEYQSFALDNDHEEEEEEPFTPFVRWTGTLDTALGLHSRAQRSGFAAMRSPQFPLDGANLQGLYNALEIRCRSDGRMYTVNLKVASSIPDDLYQGHLLQQQQTEESPTSSSSSLLSGPFDTLVLPFSEFRLSAMGRQRDVVRQLDDNICIESIGFALMDGQDGPFQFDLARIRAVNLIDDDKYVYQGEEQDQKS